MRVELFSFSFVINVGREECSNLRKMVIFGILRRCSPLPQDNGPLREWFTLYLSDILRVVFVSF